MWEAHEERSERQCNSFARPSFKSERSRLNCPSVRTDENDESRWREESNGLVEKRRERRGERERESYHGTPRSRRIDLTSRVLNTTAVRGAMRTVRERERAAYEQRSLRH